MSASTVHSLHSLPTGEAAHGATGAALRAVPSAAASSGVDRWRGTFHELAPGLPGAGTPWLAAVRERAIEHFAETGWPTNRLEHWRHTSLQFLDKETFSPIPRQKPAKPAESAGLHSIVGRLRTDAGGHWLVFVDGHFAQALSDTGTLPAGAEVSALSHALEHEPDQPHEPDRPSARPSEGGLASLFGDGERCEAPAALNAAFAADGALVRLARGVVLAEPVHLVCITASAGGATHLRHLVGAAAGAQATVVEHYLAYGDAAAGAGTLTNVVTRIDIGDDARITHVKLQQEAAAAVHLASIDAVQRRGSQFTSHSMSFGARLARNDIGTRLDGEGCDVLLNGLYHVDGRRHVDHHTRIDHAQPRGTSREFYRGILDDAGRGVFTGRILVAPGAARTDAVQRTDSLLLSGRAEADARPELEIYADDVKCAHGATVGQIDEEGLFYLRSRGLDETHARNMLTFAFAAQALARIDVPSLRRSAEAAIRSCLPGAASVEVTS